MSDSDSPEDADKGCGNYIDSGVGTPDSLQRLWAPYRMNYITSNPSQVNGSAPASGTSDVETADQMAQDAQQRSQDPFVAAPQGSDEDGLIIARGDTVYALLNLYPYNNGHLMVVPYRQVADLEQLSDVESLELMKFAQHAIATLKYVSNPDGFNVGFNLGSGAGGSVRDHLHLHVVPRWSGDANFMTVLGGTKVLPQLLRDTRVMLANAWAELDAKVAHNRAAEGNA